MGYRGVDGSTGGCIRVQGDTWGYGRIDGGTGDRWGTGG